MGSPNHFWYVKNLQFCRMSTLIIGGGLAGISMAKRCMEGDEPFTMICDRSQPSSTAIATGMYNPVVFRRLNLSWMVDELLPFMHQFYAELSQLLSTDLDTAIAFEKRIPSDDYKLLWEQRREDPIHKRFMAPIKGGFGPVLEAGIIDCTNLQTRFLDLLQEQGNLKNAVFTYSELQVQNNRVTYQSESYDRVVFCEGPYAVNNPYFSWLPFRPCQGEWLIIESNERLTDKVLNNKTNIIPIGENRYKLSSTYSWSTLDWDTHEEAAAELLENFKMLFPEATYEVIEQRAALRPTVADRRPYLGAHPDHPMLYIFNGLGSKGVMLAPFFSQHLYNHIFHKHALMEEVDIHRHLKRFRNWTDINHDSE